MTGFDPKVPTSGLSSDGRVDDAVPDPTAPLMRYLTGGQPESFFERLYASEAAALGMFRLLPSLCRQIVMSLLWSPGPIKARDLKVMVKLDPHAPQANMEHKVEVLNSLHILSSRTKRGIWFHYMNSVFRVSLSNALTAGGTSNAFGAPYERRPGDGSLDVSLDELSAYGNDRWEGMLKFMVSSSANIFEAAERPNKAVTRLLVQSGLMSYSANSNSSGQVLKITSQGFQFLLEDRALQIWQMLMFYLRSRSTDGYDDIEDAVDVLSLYFSLGSMQFGRSYSTSKMSQRWKAILNDMEDYGLIYKRPIINGKKHDQFYPTRLATTLCSGAVGVGIGHKDSAAEKGFLILETNYKIYAYTYKKANELEIAILNLFVDILIRYPNLIVGKLERNNVKKAMEEGITAHQIISYLTTHAHPQMHKNNPLLPITVVDQLHLWDKERHRLKTQEGNLFQFRNKDLFEVCVDWAKDNGVLLYKGERTHPNTGYEGNLFIAGIAKEQLAAYINEKRTTGL